MTEDEDGAIWTSRGGSRRRRTRVSSWLPVVVILALLVGLGVIVTRVIDQGPKAIPFVGDSIADLFADPEDYEGPGEGEVTFEVAPGDSISTIARNLEAAGIVASAEAFEDAAEDTAGSDNLQTGYYVMLRKMSAQEALDRLIARNTRFTGTFTITPGKTVDELTRLLAKEFDIPRKEFKKALRDADALGLPAGAKGNPEGYLMPGQYPIVPNATAASMLKMMVDAFKAYVEDNDVEARAEELGYTVHEVLTIASIVQGESSTLEADDRAKVARVIYNRLEIDPNPTAGYLEMDSTVHYALGDRSTARPTIEQIESVADNPYNTYEHKGLPPGPIDSPSTTSLEAALAPAKGPWFFFVTVNLRTGLTKFTDSFDEFQQFRAELDAYCDRPGTKSC